MEKLIVNDNRALGATVSGYLSAELVGTNGTKRGPHPSLAVPNVARIDALQCAAMAKKKKKKKWRPKPPPPFLYKYRSLSPPETRGFTLDIIRNNEIHFASSSSFNDPFESKFALRVGATPQQRLTYWTNGFRNAGQSQQNAEALAQQYNTRFEQYPDDFHEAEFGKILEEEIPQQAALLSLSTRPDDLLMWAHYASSHTGICLKFAVSVEQPFFTVAQEVEYSHDYPEFNYFTSTSEEKLNKSVLTKSNHWKYEAREYRVLGVMSQLS